MPPKSRPPSRPSKQKPKKPLEPQDEPEFLEAADELEKSGGKWRAGDAAKAARFFARANDVYEAGLRAFPSSFDLAYNKALLQYHITQDPRIAAHFGDTVELLRQTLEAHKQALRLDEQNADILFNTAQVLASLADALDDDEDNKPEQIKLLQESIELFSTCLARQEKEYADAQAMMQASNNTEAEPASNAAAATASHPDASTSASTSEPSGGNSSASSGEQGGDWATVIEPTTPNTLLETALAELSSLTALAALTAPANASTLATLANLAAPLLHDKIPAYIALLPATPPPPPPVQEGASLSILSATSATFSAGASGAPTSPQEDAQREARLASANWDAALAEAQYRSGLLSADEYAGRINEAFSYVLQTAETAGAASGTVDDLTAFADVLIAFDAALSDPDVPQSQTNLQQPLPRLRWTALTSAQDMLKQASETMGAKTPAVYLARGDVEVRRARLAESDGAADKVKTLLGNAGVYYRGAVTLASAAAQGKPDQVDEAVEAGVKEGVVRFMVGKMEGGAAVGGAPKGAGAERVNEILAEMVEDGLVDGGIAEEYAGAIGM